MFSSTKARSLEISSSRLSIDYFRFMRRNDSAHLQPTHAASVGQLPLRHHWELLSAGFLPLRLACRAAAHSNAALAEGSHQPLLGHGARLRPRSACGRAPACTLRRPSPACRLARRDALRDCLTNRVAHTGAAAAVEAAQSCARFFSARARTRAFAHSAASLIYCARSPSCAERTRPRSPLRAHPQRRRLRANITRHA